MELSKKLSRLVGRLLFAARSRDDRPILLVSGDVWSSGRSLEESRGLDTVQASGGSSSIPAEVELKPTLERPYDSKYQIFSVRERKIAARVTIRNDFALMSEIALWCSENLTDAWDEELTSLGRQTYLFKNHQDATLFALRWS